MMLDLIQIVRLKYRDKYFFWGLLPELQVVYLLEDEKLKNIISRKSKHNFSFTIFENEAIISVWNLQLGYGVSFPLDEILHFAKLLFYAEKNIYSEVAEKISDLKIPFKKSWLFPDKIDFFRFLFSTFFENWNNLDDFPDETVFEKIMKMFAVMGHEKVDFQDFKKWLKTEKTFFLKLVGEDYYLDFERKNIREISEILQKGGRVNLLSESFNENDNRAIGVYLSNGKKIGYLRKPVANVLQERFIREKYYAEIAFVDLRKKKNSRLILKVNFVG